ncbi:MAG TPA: alpha/beta fold hydrolase [Steroidobacteraceae bacterium]|nr:alpha/beta fold hydrolase [Steroidobacteraceae bacterium]
MRPPRAERVRIAGPAGEIEALVESPADGSTDGTAPARFGVVCHPHPLYGGTLDNKVVYTLARAFVELGAPAIRFNFRGVGGSAGSYDEGRGETADALAVIAYGRDRWPDASLWLAGFSFGGAVALRAAAQSHPQRLVAVAPGVTRIAMEGVGSPDCPWLVVQGDADDVVEPPAVLGWVNRQTSPAVIRVLPGAGHFFHGRLHELRAVVLEYLEGPEEPPFNSE